MNFNFEIGDLIELSRNDSCSGPGYFTLYNEKINWKEVDLSGLLPMKGILIKNINSKCPDHLLDDNGEVVVLLLENGSQIIQYDYTNFYLRKLG